MGSVCISKDKQMVSIQVLAHNLFGENCNGLLALLTSFSISRCMLGAGGRALAHHHSHQFLYHGQLSNYARNTLNSPGWAPFSFGGIVTVSPLSIPMPKLVDRN